MSTIRALPDLVIEAQDGNSELPFKNSSTETLPLKPYETGIPIILLYIGISLENQATIRPQIEQTGVN